MAALYSEHARWLGKYVRNLAENWAVPPSVLDPEDVVHEAFVSLLRYESSIQNPGAWLCVVARNQVTKAAQRQRRITGDDPAEHLEATTASWSSLSRRADAEVVMAARAVVDAMADLPGNQQVATYLSRVQGWPHADIAEFLGCSASAAGVHVHRGTAHLARTVDRPVPRAALGRPTDRLNSTTSTTRNGLARVVVMAASFYLVGLALHVLGIPVMWAVAGVVGLAFVAGVAALVVVIVRAAWSWMRWLRDRRRARRRGSTHLGDGDGS